MPPTDECAAFQQLVRLFATTVSLDESQERKRCSLLYRQGAGRTFEMVDVLFMREGKR